jgi:chromatin remodeling complex protein RSC6
MHGTQHHQYHNITTPASLNVNSGIMGRDKDRNKNSKKRNADSSPAKSRSPRKKKKQKASSAQKGKKNPNDIDVGRPVNAAASNVNVAPTARDVEKTVPAVGRQVEVESPRA